MQGTCHNKENQKKDLFTRKFSEIVITECMTLETA